MFFFNHTTLQFISKLIFNVARCKKIKHYRYLLITPIVDLKNLILVNLYIIKYNWYLRK